MSDLHIGNAGGLRIEVGEFTDTRKATAPTGLTQLFMGFAYADATDHIIGHATGLADNGEVGFALSGNTQSAVHYVVFGW